MEKKDVKIIANYLPQYHSIPENDKWWGKGYTDWVAVKKSKPLFNNHRQPRVPLNSHYYSLDEISEIKWQAKLAKDYGIDGFAIYHYWFSSDLHLLDKPVILLKEHPEIDINYLFIWDNGSWKRTWSNVKTANDWAPLYEDKNAEHEGDGLLAELKYGDKNDWKIHFDYLLTFFKDPRYIKVNNKPLIGFFNMNNSPEIIKEMVNYWNKLAIENGFSGILDLGNKNDKKDYTSKTFVYNPAWSAWSSHNLVDRIMKKVRKEFYSFRGKPETYDYAKVWGKILSNSKKLDKNTYLSGFVSYDDSPRRGEKSRIVIGEDPIKFEKYLDELIDISAQQGKEFVFLTAWNEWGEGAYLEPDSYYKYDFLKAIRNNKLKYAGNKK